MEADAQPICTKCSEYIFQGGDSGPLETVFYNDRLDQYVVHYLHNGRFFLDHGGAIMVFEDLHKYSAAIEGLEFMGFLE